MTGAPVVTGHAVRFETERLFIRDTATGDCETIARYFCEPQAQRHILEHQADPAHMLRIHRFHAEYSRKVPWREREHFVLGACLRKDGTLIGTCNLNDAVAGGRDAMLGWHFGAGHGGRGYGTEATIGLLRFAFDVLGVRRVQADCFADNERAIAVLAKAGLRPVPTGRFRGWLRARAYGARRPVTRFAIDKGDPLGNDGGAFRFDHAPAPC